MISEATKNHAVSLQAALRESDGPAVLRSINDLANSLGGQDVGAWPATLQIAYLVSLIVPHLPTRPSVVRPDLSTQRVVKPIDARPLDGGVPLDVDTASAAKPRMVWALLLGGPAHGMVRQVVRGAPMLTVSGTPPLGSLPGDPTWPMSTYAYELIPSEMPNGSTYLIGHHQPTKEQLGQVLELIRQRGLGPL